MTDELGICCPEMETMQNGKNNTEPEKVKELRKEFRGRKQTEVASWPEAMCQSMQLQGGATGQCARPYELRKPAAKR